MAKKPTKIRKQVCFEPNQELNLKRLSRKFEIAETEIIRQAIDHYTKIVFPTRRKMAAWEREGTFITKLIRKGSVPGDGSGNDPNQDSKVAKNQAVFFLLRLCLAIREGTVEGCRGILFITHTVVESPINNSGDRWADLSVG